MPWSSYRPTVKAMADPVDLDQEPDDAALADAARKNPRAFAALYERYVKLVYRYCLVHLGNREAAEDATSETFLKALAGLDGYRGGVFAAWLFRITKNVVIDAQRHHRPTQPMDIAADPVDSAWPPEDIALALVQREALCKALAALPDDQRATIELQLAGWSGERIAGALGKSHAAVKMLRVRAVARLRKFLKNDGWDPQGG